MQRPIAITFLLCSVVISSAAAADWPQWRYDAQRTANSPEALPEKLYLQWSRQLPKPEQAWQDKSNRAIWFDRSYQPVVMGKTIFIPSMVRDNVTAYNTDTGVERWRFYSDGPIRFAPAAHKGRIYFVSDDGYLYCLNAEDGQLKWKFRGGPGNYRIIGNHRLIGMWPARGGPVVYDDTVYFAAGIWPFMGTFVHAVDTETGKAVWSNSQHGCDFVSQPHVGAAAFGRLAAQGYLAATSDILLVPGGRTNPAGFHRKTGKFAYLRSLGHKKHASYQVVAQGDYFFTRTGTFSIKNGSHIHRAAQTGVFTPKAIYRDGLLAVRSTPDFVPKKDRKGNIRKDKNGNILKVAQFKPFLELDLRKETGGCSVSIKAGNRLYGANGKGDLVALELKGEKEVDVSWRGKVKGSPWSMLAADGKLLVVTLQGGLFCFGGKPADGAEVKHALENSPHEIAASAWTGKARKVLELCGQKSGYCVSLGLGSGRLVEELLRQSGFYVIVIEPDAAKVAAFRRRMDKLGLYGQRVVAYAENPFRSGLPPYLANVVVTEDLAACGLDPANLQVEEVFRILRPYGGVACFWTRKGQAQLVAQLKGVKLKGAQVSVAADMVSLERKGPLPGAASWTHQYADAANSVCSKDKLVKPPFGLLWFGGPPNDPILPRHGHGPSPQVVGGRLFIEGVDLLRAVDVYTGRLLWEKKMKGIGTYYNNTKHHPGANDIGSNYVSLADGIYVKTPQSCLRLDPVTGETQKRFTLPPPEGGDRPHWGFVTVSGNQLIAATSPIGIPILSAKALEAYTKKAREGGNNVLSDKPSADIGLKDIKDVQFNVKYSSSSKKLHVMDRHSGRLLWSRDAVHAFRHNTIIGGSGMVFCIDKMSPSMLICLRRRGYEPKTEGVLYALDAKTGEVRWKTSHNVFGTWLGYSEEHDVLLQAGSKNSDRSMDEVGKGLVAYQGKSGKVLWKDLKTRYKGPCVLHHDKIIMDNLITYAGRQMVRRSLLTGKRIEKTEPLTGKRIDWIAKRLKGCATPIAGEHLLAFRSGAAGYVDLTRDGGTASLGGFKSGCTSNLIPADGVLNAPDYTRTCACAYHNQSSLALIHMPDAEMWAFNAYKKPKGRVRRVGVNLGAPGDRRSSDGTLWLDYPSVGHKSPKIIVAVNGKKAEYFRHHSMLVKNRGNKPWVAASGVSGVDRINVWVERASKRPKKPPIPKCKVILHFADFESKSQGERVFSVYLQGKVVLSNFDIVKAAGGTGRSVVREFSDIPIGYALTIDFKSIIGDPLLCGVEIRTEERDQIASR